MSFVRKNTTNGAFRKVTASTAFGGGGSNMLSLTSTVNSGTTTATSNGNSTDAIPAKSYVDSKTSPPSLSTVMSVGNSVGTTALNMNGLNINNLATPINNHDAATKRYVDATNVWFDLNAGYGLRNVSQVLVSLSTFNTIISAPRFDSDFRRPVRIMYTMHFIHGSNFSNYNTNAIYSIFLRFYNPPPSSALPYYSQAVDKAGSVMGPYTTNENFGFFYLILMQYLIHHRHQPAFGG